VETPKRHILGRKHTFWRIDRADRSINAIWVRAEESKKRKETQRCDNIFAQTTHVALSSPKLSCVVGSLDVVNCARFPQNRFRGFGFMGSRNLPFSYAWDVWLLRATIQPVIMPLYNCHYFTYQRCKQALCCRSFHPFILKMKACQNKPRC